MYNNADFAWFMGTWYCRILLTDYLHLQLMLSCSKSPSILTGSKLQHIFSWWAMYLYCHIAKIMLLFLFTVHYFSLDIGLIKYCKCTVTQENCNQIWLQVYHTKLLYVINDVLFQFGILVAAYTAFVLNFWKKLFYRSF